MALDVKRPKGYRKAWNSGVKPVELGRFDTFTAWVNYASSRTYPAGVVFYDAAGRECRIGADFMRARDEGTFPVVYFGPRA